MQNGRKTMKSFIYKTIKSHYHLWYLFAIIGIYMIIPFLRKIVINKQIFQTFIVLSFILLLIIPSFIHILSLRFITMYYLIDELYRKMLFQYLSINHFYFIYGYYLNIKNIDNIINRILIYFCGIIGIIFTTKISYDFSILKNKKIDYYNFKYLNIFFYATSLFIFFKYNLAHSKNNNKLYNYSRYISKYTFGIYLIHPLILENFLWKFKLHALKINLLYLIPINTLIVFMLSLISSIILKNIPFIGKYIV